MPPDMDMGIGLEALVRHAVPDQNLRQFSKHYVVRDGGAVRPVPTAAQVMNALRAESALDERVACEEESKSARICSCAKQSRDDSQQSKKNKTKGKQQQGKGRYKSKQQNEGRKQVDKKKETLATAASVKTPAGTEMEWVLDSANDVHVCNQRSVLHNVRKDDAHFFQGYDGNVREDKYVGDVTPRVTDNKKPHTELKLPFTNVLLSPTAPDNLLSMGTLEREGWVVKFGFINSQRVCWLRKDRATTVED
ncbi:unnamed protein product [Phytophthora fragariaefolia]|uniref:Unnamed protein product n=1 Tax=Phytophthora fragariaefolia TaxID=1490495 RepID=A0A9W6U2T6_9STRA|nr:unnamed protein product [Phytophthora fragariaefolia]